MMAHIIGFIIPCIAITACCLACLSAVRGPIPQAATAGPARRISAVTVIIAMAAGVLAAPSEGRAEANQDAGNFIQTLASGAIAAVGDHGLSESARDERFRHLFVSSFDIPEIGRFVLSRYWRTAAPAQQQEFLRLFEDFVVLTWTGRFKEYNGETLELLGTTTDGADGWQVDSRILRGQAAAIPVQWRLRRSEEGGFRVIDIIVENVSMAVTLRSDYSAALQANGGQVDSLLSTMRAKIGQLKAAN